MPILKIHLEKSFKYEKFPFGPITSPNPGPTFDIEVAAAEIAVTKSKMGISEILNKFKNQKKKKK